MTISPSDGVKGKIAEHTPRETRAARPPDGAGPGKRAESTAAAETGIRQIRKQIVVVQRSLCRFQGILGGLEQFREFLDPGRQFSTQAVTDFIGKVSYRGEAVLADYGQTLKRIAADKDQAALEKLLFAVRRSIEQLAVQLSRFETAEQNSRSLSASADLLAGLLAALKSEGIGVQERLLSSPEAENVLDLLT